MCGGDDDVCTYDDCSHRFREDDGYACCYANDCDYDYAYSYDDDYDDGDGSDDDDD